MKETRSPASDYSSENPDHAKGLAPATGPATGQPDMVSRAAVQEALRPVLAILPEKIVHDMRINVDINLTGVQMLKLQALTAPAQSPQPNAPDREPPLPQFELKGASIAEIKQAIKQASNQPSATSEAERRVVEAFLNRVEKLAFEMPPPNTYTPRFVQLAIECRQALEASDER